MQRLATMVTQTVVQMMAVIILALPTYSASAADNTFPKLIALPTGIPFGFRPEGFAIGRGTSAYAGSLSGAIYKMDLRTGEGRILVPVQDPAPDAVVTLGMRVDQRSNYLFVAGGLSGSAFVYDADSGVLLAVYQLGPAGESAVNDLAITRDAVYFTDSFRPVFYRLPLSAAGGLPSPAAVLEVPLTGDFEDTFPGDFGIESNGIVATPDAKFLIIGHSNQGRLYRVDPTTGHADRIVPDVGTFPDGMVLIDHTLYTLHPFFLVPVDQVQAVRLDKDWLSGEFLGTITDPDLDGIASGARFGNSIYVNNARYLVPPEPDTEYWITKLDIHAIQE